MGPGGVESTGESPARSRRVVYCLIPPELADQLHELLREHYAELPDVEVVVEMRRAERRGGAERRAAEGEPPGEERRRLEAPNGRRAGERRASQVTTEPLPLPRRARRHAKRIAFVERVEPATLGREDRDTARLVARFQAGDKEAFSGIYRRYYDRVYSYLKVAIRDSYEAEDVAQDVFMKVFERIGKYERREQPFRSWLFRIVRNEAISQLRRAGKIEPTDPTVLNERLADEATPDLDAVLGWIADRDLAVVVERLPLPQRQALLLRFGFGLNSTESARILGRKPSDVRMLQHRALEYLRQRLGASRVAAATEQADTRRRDQASTRPVKRADVMRARRYVLK